MAQRQGHPHLDVPDQRISFADGGVAFHTALPKPNQAAIQPDRDIATRPVTDVHGDPQVTHGPKLGVHGLDRMRILTWIVMFGLALTVSLADFGLPPFRLQMPTWVIGVVTPTCGLTRATTALARGEFGLAQMFNPAAFLLEVAAVASIVRWVVGRATEV